MYKKILCTILTAGMLFGASLMPAAAATFPDVTEKSYEWALDAVEEMVDDGIIKGYTDGTFKPERTISKIEALVLSARILGYNESITAPFTSFATEFYADVLEKYDTLYKGEIAFLLYKDVISEKELSYYIGGENANAGMKRYEVAKLLTRVMGAGESVDPDASTAEYKDSADIPADAKPYVRFVTDTGLMKGMDGAKFAPMTDVNRAQMATLLYRLRGEMQETFSFGSVKEVDSELESVAYITEDGEETVTVPFNVTVRVKEDGYAVDFARISLGADVLITKRGGIIYAIDTLTREPDETFEGVISSVSVSTKKKEITVYPLGDESNAKTYKIAEDASVTYEGSTGSLSDLKRLQAVKLQIRGGEAVVIEATESERTIKGTVENIILEPELIYTIRLTGGALESYPVAETVTAKRNGANAEASAILVGDKVTITLRYEKVAVVTATSSKFITQGTIEEITIATLPSIKIRANNAVTSYSLSRDCVYTVDSAVGTIYDLRLGAAITASVDSETVVSLTSTTPATSAAITGTIETINNSYGFFTLSVLGENNTVTTMQVFTKRANLKIINSADGTNKKVSDLKSGMKVSVTGATVTGAFEATAIIIMPES